MKREKTQISKIRNEKEKIAANSMEIQGIIRDYFENLYSNKLQNLEEMDIFLDIFLKRYQKYTMEKRRPLQQIFLGKVAICLQKTETRSMPVTLC
jgi:hypothetical protein